MFDSAWSRVVFPKVNVMAFNVISGDARAWGEKKLDDERTRRKDENEDDLLGESRERHLLLGRY